MVRDVAMIIALAVSVTGVVANAAALLILILKMGAWKGGVDAKLDRAVRDIAELSGDVKREIAAQRRNNRR
jgi:hypothetical protein